MTSTTVNDSAGEEPPDRDGDSQDDRTREAGEVTNEYARKSAESAAQDLTYEHLGPYRVIKKIGEGGMGSVFLAEQEVPIRRQVAVKVIKNQLGSSQVIARFEAERQALAMMDHPNIAKVLDAGTAADGSPYFAMELVNGVPFNEYCDSRKLTIRQRLMLFLPVCQAVQHAHQKGIIHRDLKPSNVLVGLYDGQAIPKVIDFGLAKATELQTQLSDKSMNTEFGAVVGTLQYMSPEQAGMEQLDIDTRTDVYSLGVMLYEILTGTLPLNKETIKQNVLLKILEMIREVDPPRPSARLSQSANTIVSISKTRMIEPRRLRQTLRGELDWIVMKSLEKQRTRRYDTASDLARDLQRYLDDEPVEARPPSFLYRARKTIKRNRGLAISATAILMVLVVSLGVITSQYFEQRKLAKDNEKIAIENKELADAAQLEADRAKAEAEKQRATTEFLFDVLGAGDPIFSNITSRYGDSMGSNVTVQEVVARAAQIELLDDEAVLRDRPLLRAQILHALADVCVLSSEFPLAREALAKSHDLLTEQNSSAADIGKVLASQGLLDYIFGDMELARSRLVQAQTALKAAYEADPQDVASLRKLQDSRLALGAVLVEFDLHKDAVEQFNLMAAIDPDSIPEARVQIKAAKLFALTTELDRRRIEEEPLWPLLRQLTSALVEFINPTKSRGLKKSIVKPLSHIVLAAGYVAFGSNDQAFKEFDKMHLSLIETLGETHLLNCFPLFLKAQSADQMKKKALALENVDKLLELVDLNLGVRSHPRLAQVLKLRAELLFALASSDAASYPNGFSDAVAAMDEAIAVGAAFFPADSYKVANAYFLRGRIQSAMQRFPEAADDFRLALESRVLRHGELGERTLPARFEYARALEQAGRLLEAAAQTRAMISVLEAQTKRDESQLGLARSRLQAIESRIP